MRIIAITLLWLVAGACAIAAGVYAVIASNMVDDTERVLVIHAKAIIMGFVPWLVAYGGTRVLYDSSQESRFPSFDFWGRDY